MKPKSNTVTARATCPPDARCTARLGSGYSCGSVIERSKIFADLVTVTSQHWREYASHEVSMGRLPRTATYLYPVLSGGGEWSLGRGVHRRGMAFVGAVHAGASVLDKPHQRVLVMRVDLDDADEEEVLFDDFESMGWPAIRAPGGKA